MFMKRCTLLNRDGVPINVVTDRNAFELDMDAIIRHNPTAYICILDACDISFDGTPSNVWIEIASFTLNQPWLCYNTGRRFYL